MQRLLMLAAFAAVLSLAGSAATAEAQWHHAGHHHHFGPRGGHGYLQGPHGHHPGHYGYYPHRQWGSYFQHYGWRPWYGRSGFYVRGPRYGFEYGH